MYYEKTSPLKQVTTGPISTPTDQHGYMNWKHYEETVKKFFSQKQVNYDIYPFMKRKFIY